MCTVFFTSPRLMLPILPVCYVWAGAALFRSDDPSFVGQGRRWHLALSLAVVVVLVTFVATVRQIPGFVAMHPVEEVRTLVDLERKHGTNIVVVGTAPYFDRHVRYAYRDLRVPSGGQGGAPFEDRLRDHLRGVDYLVVGRLTGRGLPPGLVDASEVPSFLETIDVGPDVVVFRVR
jgi:hypothetical protein